MSETATDIEKTTPENPTDEPAVSDNKGGSSAVNKFYQIRFRQKHQIHSASSKIQNLTDQELVMVQTDHGQEPAIISGRGAVLHLEGFDEQPALYTIARRASRDEVSKFENLIQREEEALAFCNKNIEKLGLEMKLIRVERYFNGSKIIFYFTAENRVDFRALVKDLVQEFRTRVEMRQIGVRHETQMLGGLGCCGRELCCASFMTKFVPVSIKMAKEQNLPLNPSKISGACNRLLCCLTHEFDTYKSLKRDMPKPGKTIIFDGEKYKVKQVSVLKSTVTVTSIADSDLTKVLTKDEWQNAEILGKQKNQQEPTKKQKSPEANQNQQGQQDPEKKPRAEQKSKKQQHKSKKNKQNPKKGKKQ